MADAQASGACGRKIVWVQVPSPALLFQVTGVRSERMRLLKSEYICEMQECRNWQTSKTKDLVSIALVWVQVPSSAFKE